MYSFQNHEPLQVELVSRGFDAWIPVVAIAISLFSIALTLWFRFNDRLILKVELGTSMLLDHAHEYMPGQDLTTVTVTNMSRAATTQVSSLLLEFNHGKTFAYMEPGPDDSTLPVVLGPGESARVSYKNQGLGITLNGSNEGKYATWLRGKAVCGHNTIRGKKHRKFPEQLRKYAIENPYRPGRSF